MKTVNNSESFDIVFLIGAARSGTTLLGEQVLSKHPEIFFLLEPDYVWLRALGYRKDDVLTSENVSNEKSEKIFKDLLSIINNKKKKILLEKTPSNCFRIPFIKSVFPEAKYIHIIRDGREVALSSSKEWAAQNSKALDSKEIRSSKFINRISHTIKRNIEIQNRFKSIKDFYFLPQYGLKFVNYLRRQILKNDKIPWGPRFPGIKQVRKRFSLLETCAIQWERSVVAAESGLSLINPDKVFRLKYEDFIQNPHKYLTDLCNFMDISSDKVYIKDMTSSIVPRDTSKWEKTYSEKEIEAVMNQISFTSKNLGYKL